MCSPESKPSRVLPVRAHESACSSRALCQSRRAKLRVLLAPMWDPRQPRKTESQAAQQLATRIKKHPSGKTQKSPSARRFCPQPRSRTGQNSVQLNRASERAQTRCNDDDEDGNHPGGTDFRHENTLRYRTPIRPAAALMVRARWLRSVRVVYVSFWKVSGSATIQ